MTYWVSTFHSSRTPRKGILNWRASSGQNSRGTPNPMSSSTLKAPFRAAAATPGWLPGWHTIVEASDTILPPDQGRWLYARRRGLRRSLIPCGRGGLRGLRPHHHPSPYDKRIHPVAPPHNFSASVSRVCYPAVPCGLWSSHNPRSPQSCLRGLWHSQHSPPGSPCTRR